MFLELGINNDQIFVSETNYLEVLKVSSYEELKSAVISEYEAETFSKYNLVYETGNFYKDSKWRECVKYAQIVMY